MAHCKTLSLSFIAVLDIIMLDLTYFHSILGNIVLKKVIWVNSSQKDLRKMPETVKAYMGYGIYLAQMGEKHVDAKILKGFGGASVIELRDSDTSGTYRVIYTTQMKDILFVLHAFQKKSKQGIKTPQTDIDLIKNRLKAAKDMYNEINKNK